MPWLQEDEKFRQQLIQGHQWEVFVAKMLTAYGCSVTVKGTPEFRAHSYQKWLYADEVDIGIVEGRHAGKFIEVKSTGRELPQDPWDFVPDDQYVETVSSTRRRASGFPLYWVFVSRQNRHMLVLHRESFRQWFVRERQDRTRGFGEPWWVTPKIALQSFFNMVADLKGSL